MLGLLRQYFWALDLATVLLCSYFGAKLTNLYIAQKISVETTLELPKTALAPETAQKEQPSFSDYQVILERNIFDSQEITAAPDETQTAQTTTPTGEPVKTGLALQILGVLVVGSGEDSRSSATVSGQGKIDTYAVGDENGFAPGTVLKKIKPDRIIFAHQGRLEYALFEEEVGPSIFGPPPSELTIAVAPKLALEAPKQGDLIKKEGEGKFVIDQKEVHGAFDNLERLYTEIRAVPNFAGGKVAGMKILSVKQGSLFDKLGLQRGDILEKINGVELDVKKGFEIFAQLRNEKRLIVDLVRQGAKKTFEYDVR